MGRLLLLTCLKALQASPRRQQSPARFLSAPGAAVHSVSCPLRTRLPLLLLYSHLLQQLSAHSPVLFSPAWGWAAPSLSRHTQEEVRSPSSALPGLPRAPGFQEDPSGQPVRSTACPAPAPWTTTASLSCLNPSFPSSFPLPRPSLGSSHPGIWHKTTITLGPHLPSKTRSSEGPLEARRVPT